jgi:hypothetical protein
MNPASYYHSPPKPASTRALCPVCNQAVYSQAGIHPQCAERLADPPRAKGKAKGAVIPVDLATTENGAAVVKPPVVARGQVSVRAQKPFRAK